MTSNRPADPEDRRPVVAGTLDACTVARLRRWYARAIDGRWSAAEMVLTWLVRIPPNIWNLGWPATEAERADHPGLYLTHRDGTSWGPRSLAIARHETARRLADDHWMLIGETGQPAFLFGPPISELVRCDWVWATYRARSRHQLEPRPGEADDEALSRLLFANGIAGISDDLAHVARRKGVSPTTGRPYRRSVGAGRLARALLVWGLVDTGMAHRAAIRLWLSWEIELGGPAADSGPVREAWDLAREGSDRDAVREFEDSQRGANDQFWRAMGIGR